MEFYWSSRCSSSYDNSDMFDHCLLVVCVHCVCVGEGLCHIFFDLPPLLLVPAPPSICFLYQSTCQKWIHLDSRMELFQIYYLVSGFSLGLEP